MSDSADAVKEGISDGIQKSKLSFRDPRLLVIYVLFVIFIVGSSLWQNHVYDHLRDSARRQYDNCVRINRTNAGVNDFLLTVSENAQTSTALTPAEKAQRAAAYSKIRFAIVPCGARP